MAIFISFIVLAALSVLGIVAAVRETARDGYRQISTRATFHRAG